MSTAGDWIPENPILAYLQTLIATKKNLPHGQPVAAYVSHSHTDSASLLRLAAELGPHIAILQVPAEVIDDWSSETIYELQYLARKHGFLLWEGSKILNSLVGFMGRGDAPLETRQALSELIKKSYACGPIRTATWANVATSWAPAVAVNQQEKDALIPTLRTAAREAVATTAKTIQTEISVERNNDLSEDEMEVSHSFESTSTGWKEFSPDNMGGALRKLSTISVTEYKTPHPDIQPDDGVPAPPTLARSISLCLPSSINTGFKPEFRQSSIIAALANSDFVLGFATSEPFFINHRGNDIFELALMDGCGVAQEGMDCSLLSNSPYVDKQGSMAIFSLIPPPLGNGFEYDPNFKPNGRTVSDSEIPASAQYLHHIVGQAVAFREQSRQEHEPNGSRSEQVGPNLLHFPAVIIA
jgi:hypothetical protein